MSVHSRSASSTVRSVVRSTPAPMRSHSPVANTSGSLAGSRSTAPASTSKSNGLLPVAEPLAPTVETVFPQAPVPCSTAALRSPCALAQRSARATYLP